jgi:dTDP-4-amino-4,6-dideoxygalactose transaminase
MRSQLQEAVDRVVQRAWFVLGEEVEAFEGEFASYLGCRHVIGVGSGTDALHLALVAIGVGQGDEVVTAANTCVPTAAAISMTGASPVLVDVEPLSFNMDPLKLESAITSRTRAIIPVHLYGQAADMDPIIGIAASKDIPVIEDVAQGHGATYRGKKLGSLGLAGCFSFYPSKNLGAFGDGGAISTDDDDLAARVKRLRNYGEERRYYHKAKGFNSRLDEIQAAVLRAKLPNLDAWNETRRSVTSFYNREITNPLIDKPLEMSYGIHNYHLYVIRCKLRAQLQSHLARSGVATLIHYPIPVHLQESYLDLGKKTGDFPVAESCAREVLSLPNFPELSLDELRWISDCINSFGG